MSIFFFPQSHNQNSRSIIKSVLKCLLNVPLSEILKFTDFVTEVRTKINNLNITSCSILMSFVWVWIDQQPRIPFKHFALVKRAFHV